MLLLLALQLGHWNGGYLLYWGYLGQEHCFLGRGRRRLSGGAGIVCTSTVYGVFRVLSAASAGRGLWMARGTGVAGPADTAAWFSVVVVAAVARGGWYHVYHLCCCYWIPGASGSTTLAWRLRLWSLPLVPVSPVGFSLPTYRCTDVWISLMSWYVGQRNICWVMDILLAVDWRRETKGLSHAAMTLTSCCHTLQL